MRQKNPKDASAPTTREVRNRLPSVFYERWRCPACLSVRLSVDKTLPEESDESVTRYVECDLCEHRFRLIEE